MFSGIVEAAAVEAISEWADAAVVAALVGKIVVVLSLEAAVVV